MKIRVCPVCLSTKIKKSSPFDGWLIPETYVCEECGYRGPIYAEIEVDMEDLEKYGDKRD